MDGEGAPRPKKALMSRSKIKLTLVFLIGKALFIMNFTTWSGGKQTVVPIRFSAFEGCCAQEEA
jgi:hypothetical protein